MCRPVTDRRFGSRALVLLSMVVMLGAPAAGASDEPLETPLYDQTRKSAVQTMETSSPDAGSAPGAADENIMAPQQTKKSPPCPKPKEGAIPTLSATGYTVLTLALVAAGSWLILRRRPSGTGAL
jgi:hypothetical protein